MKKARPDPVQTDVGAAPTCSPEAMTWRQRILDEHVITDAAGLLLLDAAMTAFDRMRQAQRIIETEGALQRDRFGLPRAHAAVGIERDARAGLLAALKALRLDVEPFAQVGRPPGR